MHRKISLQSGSIPTKVRVIVLFKTFQITFNIFSFSCAGWLWARRVLRVRAVLTAFLFYLFQWLRFYCLRVNLGLFLNVSFTRSAMCQWSYSLCKSTWDWTIFTDIIYTNAKGSGWGSPIEDPESTLVQRRRRNAPSLDCRCLRFDKGCGTDFWPHRGARDRCF